MRYFLTSGSNLELYFSTYDTIYEKGTLHFEAYNNPRMQGFPIIKEEIPNFDLRTAHSSIYGTQKIVTGCNYSGETWWFAWVDIVPEGGAGNMTLDANDQPGEDILSYLAEIHERTDTESYPFLTDPAAIACGQDHASGINITSNPAETGRVFFPLTNTLPGVIRISFPKIHGSIGWIFSMSLLTGEIFLWSSFTARNYLCEQDLFCYNGAKKLGGYNANNGQAQQVNFGPISNIRANYYNKDTGRTNYSGGVIDSWTSMNKNFIFSISNLVSPEQLAIDKSLYGGWNGGSLGAAFSDYDTRLDAITNGPPKFYPTGGPSFEEAYS